ncbi:MAG: valine--tRNA ligase [Vampirovibrionales bacterium]
MMFMTAPLTPVAQHLELASPVWQDTFDETTVRQIYTWWEQHQLFTPEVQVALQAALPHRPTHRPSGEPLPEAFSMVIPPPNVTGTLHMGHALDNTIQDVMTRYHRMLGVPTVWLPGTDHAGIATQSIVEKRLREGLIEGYPADTTRYALGRETFLKLVWEWVHARQGDILGQLKRLGVSVDWSRTRFTLQPELQQAVRKAFIQLYAQGLIYRGEKIVNWDPVSQSAISDIETEYADEQGFLWHIAYPLVSGEGSITVATTRPETLYGDVAVAVHPDDERYAAWIGQQVVLPLTGRTIPVIADTYVEKDFGTGALKITPAHDPNDFEVGERHGLTPLRIFNDKAELLALEGIPEAFHGLDRWEARRRTEEALEAQGFLQGKQEHAHRVGRSQRTGEVVEPLLSKQWFVSTKPLAEKALSHYDEGHLAFVPERWSKEYLRWMTNIQDWCISRQLWWGHAIPAWHHQETGEVYVGEQAPEPSELWKPDPDVLDTWFSSGLWPFATFGWGWETPTAQSEKDLRQFYPTTNLVTGFDIIFFWVARMVMMAMGLTEAKTPFETVYIHGLIRDEKGQKMSKSKGNTVDPVETIDALGCDGFRFGLLSMVTYGGQDIKLNKDKLEQGRFFVNKLVNLTRFTLMNCPEELTSSLTPLTSDDTLEHLHAIDQWILSKYEHTVAEANRLLATWHFAEVAQVLESFLWNDVCDWYVEALKWLLKGQTPEAAQQSRRVLLTVLEGSLRLLHPLMPHLSEFLWQQLPQAFRMAVPSVSVAFYPQSQPAWRQESLEGLLPLMFECVRAIRNIRQSYQVPHATETAVTLVIAPDAPSQLTALLTQCEPFFKHFVKLSQFECCITENYQPTDKATGMNTVGAYLQVYIPMTGIIDTAAERQRLEKKLATATAQKEQLEKLLNNEGFLAKATPQVLEEKRSQLATLQEQCESLQAQCACLL